MLHRNAPREDFHAGKWNGLGGKCEPDESPLEAAGRELAEESGLELAAEAFRPLGVLQFPAFKPAAAEDWLVFVFTVAVPPAQRRREMPCAEGTLHWIAREKLLELNLWPGDREFLPLVLEGKPFIGSFWYRDGALARRWLQAL
ncbi:MAG: 8-oxo-dGTP diphosphatase [Elusimicrobia bacterium]|nr:8-oxo-dGTP diphosphatase [Elusimicrobiota bacterium]